MFSQCNNKKQQMQRNTRAIRCWLWLWLFYSFANGQTRYNTTHTERERRCRVVCYKYFSGAHRKINTKKKTQQESSNSSQSQTTDMCFVYSRVAWWFFSFFLLLHGSLHNVLHFRWEIKPCVPVPIRTSVQMCARDSRICARADFKWQIGQKMMSTKNPASNLSKEKQPEKIPRKADKWKRMCF